MRPLVIWILLASTAFAQQRIVFETMPNETELRAAIAQTEPGIYHDIGPIITLPAGTLTLTDELLVKERSHFALIGGGDMATRFRCRDMGGKTGLALERCSKSMLEGFTVETAPGSDPIAVGVEIRTSQSGEGPISSENVVRQVNVDKAGIGFSLNSRPRSDNNEFHEFIRCRAFRCRTAGYHIYGTQAHRITYRWCVAHSCGIGLWGERGNYWQWIDGQGTDNGKDFIVGSFMYQIQVIGHRSERSKQFLLTGGEWSRMPSLFRNITWDGDPEYGEPVLRMSTNGPITFEHVDLTSRNGNPLHFRFDDHDPGSVVINGLTLGYNNPPQDDLTQQPFDIPSHFDLSEIGINQRVIRGGRITESKLEIRPDPDLSRGTVPTAIDKTEFDIGETIELAEPFPPSHRRLRSFSVTGVATFMDIDRPIHWEIVGAGGCSARILHGRRLYLNQGQHAPIELEQGKKYPFALVYNRDRGSSSLRFGDVWLGQGIDQPADRNWVVLGAIAPGRPGRMLGKIERVRLYDRSLSREEMAMVQ